MLPLNAAVSHQLSKLDLVIIPKRVLSISSLTISNPKSSIKIFESILVHSNTNLERAILYGTLAC